MTESRIPVLRFIGLLPFFAPWVLAQVVFTGMQVYSVYCLSAVPSINKNSSRLFRRCVKSIHTVLCIMYKIFLFSAVLQTARRPLATPLEKFNCILSVFMVYLYQILEGKRFFWLHWMISHGNWVSPKARFPRRSTMPKTSADG